MEIDEFELVTHFLLLRDLIGSLDDLSRQSGLLVLVFLYQGSLLTVLFLEEFLNAFGLDVARPAVLTTHQNLPLEVVCILADFSNGHISFF